MALGREATIADAVLEASLNGGTYTGPADLYMQFHTGGPGPAGTSHVATETTRKKVVFASTATPGSYASTNTQTWASPAANEQPTFASFWDASTAGAFQFSIPLDMDPLVVGVSFSFNPGDITVNENTAG